VSLLLLLYCYVISTEQKVYKDLVSPEFLVFSDKKNMTAGSVKSTHAAGGSHPAAAASAPLTTSDLMLHAHQIISLEATQRQTLLWEEQKDIATLHVSLKRVLQLESDRIHQQQRRFEATCESRIRTVERKMTLLDGEEQKLRLAILKSEVLQLEAIVRQCTKLVRGEVFTATQDAQQRIKYFNKTLDIILKKEAAGRRDLLGMERYEFLVMKQRSDKEVTDTQRESLLLRMRKTKQQQHDQERKRQEDATNNHNNNSRSATMHSRYSVNTNSLNSTHHRKSNVMSHSGQSPQEADQQDVAARRSVEVEAVRHVDDEEMEVAPEPQDDDVEHNQRDRDEKAVAETDDVNRNSVPRRARSSSSHASSSARSHSQSSSRSASSRSRSSGSDGEGRSPPRASVPHHNPRQDVVVEASSKPTAATEPVAATKQPKSSAKSITGGKQYVHVTSRVVVKHSPEFIEARRTELQHTEDLKRLKIQVSEYETWDNMYRRLMYVVTADEQRRDMMDIQKAGGDTTAQVRCVQRAIKRLTEEEQRVRQSLELDCRAAFDGIDRKVQRQLLTDQQDQRTRLAKLASHQNRVNRRLQKLEAERAQMSEAAKESLISLDVITPTEADQQLAAIGESQPYPAIIPPNELHATWTEKVADIECKRRKFIERESMLRRMVLQIYHRQKMKDFGFFDESKLRDDQMKLAAALRSEENAETLRQLHALDERIATAQLASQQRLKAQHDRDRLFRDEHVARAEIAAAYHRDVAKDHMEEWKKLQRQSKGIDFIVDEEALQRQKLIKEERNKRDIFFSSFRKFRPVAPRKPAEPLPVPPPRFEDAVQVYQEFFKKNPIPPVCGRKLSSADPESRTTYFSTAGRKYLPPAKKTAVRTGEQTLMAFHRNKTPTVTATVREDWSSETKLSSSAHPTTATNANATKKTQFLKVSGGTGSFYYTSATSATTTINFGADLAAEQSAELSSSQRRSMSSRKPRPPPREVCLASMTLQQAAVRKRNDKAGARLEPMPPMSEKPAGLESSGRMSSSSHGTQSHEASTRSAHEKASTPLRQDKTPTDSAPAPAPAQAQAPSEKQGDAAASGSAEESPQRSRAAESSVARSDRSRRSVSNESKTSERPSSPTSSRRSSPPSSRSSSTDRAGTSDLSPERDQPRRSVSPSESPRRAADDDRPVSQPQDTIDANHSQAAIDASDTQDANDDEHPASGNPHAAVGGLDSAALCDPAAGNAVAPAPDDNEPSPAKSNATHDEYGLDEFDDDE
jgi:hypothetical protein